MFPEEGTNLLELYHHLGIVVAEGIEQALLGRIPFGGADGGGDAACHLNAILFKHGTTQLHLLVGSKIAGAERLQIHFIKAHVVLEERYLLLQLFPGFRNGSMSHKIDDQLEIPIVSHTQLPPVGAYVVLKDVGCIIPHLPGITSWFHQKTSIILTIMTESWTMNSLSLRGCFQLRNGKGCIDCCPIGQRLFIENNPGMM